MLESAGYTVSVAESAEEALVILERIPVQLIISDNTMPGQQGIELLKVVRERYPNILRIMLTGDPDPDTPVRSINESEVYRFVRKPWNNADLKTILHFAFEVIELEKERRRLVRLVRKEREARVAGKDLDPMDLEAELVLLAEEETRGD